MRLREGNLIITALCRLEAEQARQTLAWIDLRMAIVNATTSENPRQCLDKAADLEYQLCGHCEVTGPLLDSLDAEEVRHTH